MRYSEPCIVAPRGLAAMKSVLLSLPPKQRLVVPVAIEFFVSIVPIHVPSGVKISTPSEALDQIRPSASTRKPSAYPVFNLTNGLAGPHVPSSFTSQTAIGPPLVT